MGVPGGSRTIMDLVRLMRNSVSLGALNFWGVDIFASSILYTCRILSSNVGAVGSIVCENLLSTCGNGSGFDSRRRRIVELESSGMLDSSKTLRVVLDTSS